MNNFQVLKGCEKLKNANKIFPLKQLELLNIVNALRPYVNKITVFGSSTTWDCNYKSDTDLIVDPNDNYDSLKVSKELSKITANGYDLFTTEQLKNADDIFKNEIQKTGVLIYE